ncbi:MAG TPA: TonB-dependent receptor [Gemmatimonadales bacterium]|nr:TonB-dependent receptor [Gemmatimonadales bacterium]
MENKHLGKRVFRAVGMCALLVLALCRTAAAQDVTVSGTVSSASGQHLQGVTVRIRGTNTSTTTDVEGKYTITAPPDAILVFNVIGYRGVAQTLGSRTTVDVAMEPSVAVLPEVVVTGYMEEQRKNATGALTSVDAQSIQRQSGASALQRLDGRAAGVTIDNGGSPGSRTTVRIRGISSFQNNDPLYVIDGTPVQDTYLNFLNPDDISSVNVLKDASAASIYGSRASNGVVIIETKRGHPGRRRVSLDVTSGVASPVKGYDGILIQNSLDYFQVVKTAFQNAGQKPPANIFGDPNNPTVPAFIWPNNGTSQTTDTLNTASYSYPNNLIMPGSPGTNWWKAVFGTGQVRNANLTVSGGGEDNAYLVSFNYLNQEGTAAFNRFQRGGVRINTTFNMNRVSVGENLSITREQGYGGLDDNGLGEDNIIGKNIFQQPVVPVFDIAGYFASGKAVGLSNLTNPLKIATVGRNNINTNDRVFGNVFGSLDASHGFSLKTRFGFNLDQNNFHGFTATTPENSEVTAVNGINENYDLFTEWTWSNTLNYVRSMDKHNLNVLLGQEATKNVNRFEAGSCAGLLSTDVSERFIQDALCDPTTKNVSSAGSVAALLSYFGKADYNYGERYFVSATVRRDGSSRLGPTHRWGTFPAIGLGWRVSNESFFPQNAFISSAMLRFGFGITGNQQIPSDRIVSQLGGDRGDTFYDIGGGSKTQITPGFKFTATGNANLKWEENRSVNVGADIEFNQGKGSFSVDVYTRNSNNLLFNPATPATGGSAAPPIVNIGKMTNKGFDLSLGYKGVIGGSTFWSATVNGAHYKNKIVQIDGISQFFFPANIIRDQNPVINMVGQPIGAFYGLVADGYYRDSLDAAPYWDDGARPGRIKFKDLNGDGHITSADRAIIGSPHPSFTGGLDLGLRHGNWDLSATIFGTVGNKIFNEEKYWYVFRYFDTNVRNDLLSNAVVLDGPCNDVAPKGGVATCPGKVTNPGAKYPRLDSQDAFSRQFSSYWVENGAYLRLRNIQLGYNLPTALVRWIPAARIYLQAENLFTITGYSGLDPSLPAADVTGAAGDTRDQYRGIDQGSYPSNRIITIGISTSF